MKLKVAGKTDKGLVRTNNEDNFTIDEGIKLIAVADGAGGQATGEVASRIAVEVIREQLRRMIYEGQPVVFLKDAEKKLSEKAKKLISSIRFANHIVYEASQKYPQNYGMATTCVAILIGENDFVYCNVGDSRLYLIRDSNLKLLTSDHSLVAEQLQKGLITKEEAEKSEYKNILTRALGVNPEVEIDTTQQEALPGDWLLLCTDGLTRMVPEKKILEVVQSNTEPAEICQKLIDEANARGGIDNIAVAIVNFAA